MSMAMSRVGERNSGFRPRFLLEAKEFGKQRSREIEPNVHKYILL